MAADGPLLGASRGGCQLASDRLIGPSSPRAAALVAQRTRASDYGSEGCGFESRRAHQESPVQSLFLKTEFPGEVAMIAN